MAAPSHTARTIPTGFKTPEGYRCIFSMAGAPTIQLWEIGGKPPSIDGGDLINTTTQWNVSWETFFPRHLKKVDDVTFEVAYDPDAWNTIAAQVNVNQSFSFFFPDGSYVDFWGVLRKVEWAELKIGEFPKATVTIGVTNTDASSVESGPVFTAAVGT